MRASIIIPALNEEKVLSKTLEATLAQEYADFEVIVIDNGSTDRTHEIASSFPIKVFIEKNKGTMWACERGRKESSGDIIIRMDADCIPEKNWLAQGMKHFESTKVIAVTGIYDYHDANKLFRKTSLYIQRYFYFFIHTLMQWMNLGAIMIGGNSFMRSDALEKIGGFDTSIVFYGDDVDTAKRLSTLGPVVFDRNLIIKTSARRFQKEGIFKITGKYFLYLIKDIMRKKK